MNIVCVKFCILLLVLSVFINETTSRRYRPKKYKRKGVIFPSGQKQYINTFTSNSGSCPQNTTTILLWPTGKTTGKEYNIVKTEFESTLGTTAKIQKIEKLANECLWRRYKMKQNNDKLISGVTNERILFHGTSSSVVAGISNNGMDERYAQLGYFGYGLYFADTAAKSHLYNSGSPRVMFLCRVNLGNMKTYPDKESDTSLSTAPAGYDSVSGLMMVGREYIVYNGEQTYPEYLITYTV